MYAVIPLIVSSISLIVSIATIVWQLLRERKKIEVICIDHMQNQNISQFFLTIKNKSRLSVAIAEIGIEVDERIYPCILTAQPVLIFLGGKDSPTTASFPIHLQSLGATTVFLRFLNLPKGLVAEGNTVRLQLQTTRGAIRKELALGTTSHYLHSST